MKTAIVIIGHIRTWDKCKGNFKESFGHLNPDVFVSTYDLQYNYHPAQRKWMGGTSDTFLSFSEIERALGDINVKGLDVENINEVINIYQQTKHTFHSNFQNDENTYLQYRKIHRAVQLMKHYEIENDFVYDTVIKIRFDIYHNKFDYAIGDKNVIISSGNVFPNDVIFGTSRDSFIKLADFYMDEFYTPKYNDSHLKPPHNLLLRGFTFCDLDIEQADIMKYVERKMGKHYYNNIS